MNKKINLIINILIITLIVALVFVMMRYYTGTPSSIPTDIKVIEDDIINSSNEESIITNNVEQKENSGETIININASGEIQLNSGEISEDTNIEEIPENETIIDAKEPSKEIDKPVIITSENEISNKEKKEVLTELDKTLMELLDVVDKVQTVDESPVASGLLAYPCRSC